MSALKIDFADVVPRLDGKSHKGQHGKVSVIGGSAEFTGAPFFSAYSAMQVGADYGNVFCAAPAAHAIKSYAPELIVHPCMVQMTDVLPSWELRDVGEETVQRAAEQSFEALQGWIEKSTCLVIGPGLGGDPIMRRATAMAMHHARERGLPFVVDADGLRVVMDGVGAVRGYRRAVLTPNAPEFWRLASAVGVEHGHAQPHENADLVQTVADKLDGPVLVAKGAVDIIASAHSPLIRAEEEGAPRRCGGQGDILSGVLGTTTSWAVAYAASNGLDAASETDVLKLAASHASMIVRRAQKLAYGKRHRSMVASDVMAALADVVEESWPR